MAVVMDLLDTSTLLIALVIFLSTLLITQYILTSQFAGNKWTSTDKNLPPSGPREWPIVGCALGLIADEPQKVFAKWSRSYGPVFRTRVGMIPTVVLSDFESIREAFVRSGDDFADRPRLGLMEYVTKGRGIVSAHVGESQRERRRFALAALRSLGMGKSRLVENIVDEIETLSDIFKGHRGEAFNPFHNITVSVANIISWIVFGIRFQHDDKDYNAFLKLMHEGVEMCEASGAIGLIPMLQYLPLPIWRKMASNQAKWKEFGDTMTKHARERPESEEPCFIQMYTDEMKRCEQNGQSTGSAEVIHNGSSEAKEGTSIFNEDDLRQTHGDLYVAGTDTTATTLKWAFLYLMLHPDVQHNIHEELDRVLGRERMPTLEDRKVLPYTEAVLLEIQRIATIVPLSVPHSTAYDTKLAGYDIPAGTFVLSNLWAVHHDPNVWKNPEEFIPERFLNEDGTAVVQRDELIPFSIGRRKCLGEQLARMELFLFFTHLLHRFEFRLPEGAPPPSLVGKAGMTRNPLPYNVCAISREV